MGITNYCNAGVIYFKTGNESFSHLLFSLIFMDLIDSSPEIFACDFW